VHIYLGWATRLSARIQVTSPLPPFEKGQHRAVSEVLDDQGAEGGLGGVRSYFLFGIAYGICSLSCTLPVFLIVVGISSTASDFVGGLYQFVSYALGMGATLLVLTLGTAVFKEVVGSYLRRVVPYVERASAGFIALAGIFVIYYWLTIGDLGRSIQGLF
jgi:cytochrome c biogenesis protein CcdA